MSSNTRSSSPTLGSLEGTILSGRYALEERIGQGAWGTIYRAKDIKLKGEPIAIKILDPTPIAKDQAEYRELTDIEENFILKEARRGLEACGHLVRRYAGEDKENSISYVVMNLYSETVQAKMDRDPQSVPVRAIGWMSDIVSAIDEYHDIYGGPHCDVKPDNMVIDRRGKLLLTDFGSSTSTRASPPQGPRDNMGFIYTRAPGNFRKGEHPKRSYDCYAAGSLLFRFFTGKYILEDEIDGARNEAESSLGGFMAGLQSRQNEEGPTDLESLVDSKLTDTVIPQQFKDFIKSAVLEKYSDGSQLKKGFDQARKSFEEEKVKKFVLDKYKDKLRNACLGVFLGASMLGAGLTGFAWTVFYAPHPDYSKRDDINTLVCIRDAKESGFTFSLEREYQKIEDRGKGRNYNAYAIQSLASKYPGKSLSSLIAQQFFLCSNRSGFEVPNWNGLRDRSVSLALGRGMDGSPFIDDVLVSLIPYYIAIEKESLGPGQDISLEGVLTHLIAGSVRYNAMRSSARSFRFDDYKDAKGKDGAFMMDRETKAFIEALIPSVWSALPPSVKRKVKESR